jgi:hypothetical protein
MPSPLYRLTRRLLRASTTGCLFVPLRGMQFQAVVDTEEIVFVDNLGGYMVLGNEGGRVIELAWRPAPAGTLDSLSKPVRCEIHYYRPGLERVQSRLVGEFGRALNQQAARGRPVTVSARIVSFNPEEST